jgi:hypothetical protein
MIRTPQLRETLNINEVLLSLLQGILRNRIKQKKVEMHRLRNMVYTDNLWIEIETLHGSAAIHTLLGRYHQILFILWALSIQPTMLEQS